MTDKERAQVYKEVADWLLEHPDIEPQIQTRLSKMLQAQADELDPPLPNPGTVVWWQDAEGLGDPALGQFNDLGRIEFFGTTHTVPPDRVKYWPARIALQEAGDD